MALLQGIRKLFDPLLDDLHCVSAVKEAMELQVEACMRWSCFKRSRSCSALCYLSKLQSQHYEVNDTWFEFPQHVGEEK